MDVITYGGGEYLFDIFNGIASLAGSGFIASLVTLAILIGLVWVLIKMIWSSDLVLLGRWFLGVIIIYGVLFIPRENVAITDRLNPGFGTRIVANVPWGLAFFASLSSTIGDEITQKTEIVFSLPNDLRYSQNGMIYGATLFESVMGVKVIDEEFNENLENFAINCVFYDLYMKNIDFNTMKESDDIWNYLTVTNTQTSSRGYDYFSGGVPSFKTCFEAANDMDTKWNAQINTTATLFGIQKFPELSQTDARARILGSLPIAHSYLLGTAKTGAEVLKQSLMVNAMNEGIKRNAAASGSTTAVEIYAQTRLDLQTTNTYNILSKQAEKWVPLLKIVFEVMYYGLFPLVLPMFLLPTVGLRLLQVYFYSFVWLQSWGPLYVILNRIMMGQAAKYNDSASGIVGSTNAISMSTLYDISSVNAQVANLAGYLAISIPFIAAGLARGAGAMSGMATSMLHPVQEGARTASHEATTGNVSLGNFSQDNASFNNVHGYKTDTGFAHAGGYSTSMVASGGTITHTPGGSSVIDSTKAMSKTPYSTSMSGSWSQAMSNRASHNEQQGDNYSAQRNEHMASAFGSALSYAQSVNRNEQSNTTAGVGGSSSLDTSAQETLGHVKTFANDHGLDTVTAASLLVNASAKAGAPGIGGIGIEGNVQNRASNTELYKAAQSYSDQHNLANSFREMTRTFSDQSFQASSSEGQSFLDNMKSEMTETVSAGRLANQFYNQADMIDAAIENSQRNSAEFSHNLQSRFVEYLADQRSEAGTTLGTHGAEVLLNSRNENDVDTVKSHLSNFISEEIGNTIQPVNVDSVNTQDFSNNTVDAFYQSSVQDAHENNRGGNYIVGGNKPNVDTDSERGAVEERMDKVENAVSKNMSIADRKSEQDQVISQNIEEQTKRSLGSVIEEKGEGMINKGKRQIKSLFD